MSDLISVIIPIYNTGDILNNCVSSVINQDYPNIEIILVDDGSTDNTTLSICDRIAKENDNVILYHKANGGSASARNYGIKYSRGKYIGFVDSDDIIDKEMYSTLYNSIKNDNVKVSICGISTEGNGKVVHNFQDMESGCYNNYKLMHYFLLGYWHSACVCLYEKSLLINVLFPEGEVNEDYIFNYHIFKQIDNISFVNEPLYHYILRENSNTSAPKTLKFLDWINHTKIILDELKHYPLLKQESEYQYLYSNIVLANSSLLTISKQDSFDANELYRIASNNLVSFRKNILKNKYLSFKNRLMGLSIAYLSRLYKYTTLLLLKLK